MRLKLTVCVHLVHEVSELEHSPAPVLQKCYKRTTPLSTVSGPHKATLTTCINDRAKQAYLSAAKELVGIGRVSCFVHRAS